MELEAEEYDNYVTGDITTIYIQLYNKNVQSIEQLIKNAIESFIP